ncbi:protein FANTASTIC FOUR 1-like [Cucurbita moschata]|uniref:Protein FANTASTIC FOUR 1-like n=1 Tax=Cucurbita moschata TaxID=3662 RepID=A0A6J1HFV2_CUCMO|nr:protein FANTASTIC FOUR 1-like [Cucurbita moschata]
MFTSVGRGLQSCVESHVLSLHLFPQKPSYPSRSSPDEAEENARHGGWSFLEALSNGNQEDKVYVHPLVKHSSTKLSKKSLEMCTESLGSESGSDMGEKDVTLLRLEAENSRPKVGYSTWVHEKAIRKDTRYPPPLTSISGSTGIRMKSYREDGRLVLRAEVNSGSGSSYFHAERSHGRLKLHMVKHSEKRGEEDGEAEEMGMEEFGRPRSCSSSSSCSKQGSRQSKEVLHWEPLWVST